MKHLVTLSGENGKIAYDTLMEEEKELVRLGNLRVFGVDRALYLVNQNSGKVKQI